MAIPTPTTAFDEIINFLASAPTAEAILVYQPPEMLQVRASELLHRNQEGNLSSDEVIELDEILRMNRFMSRLKAKTKQKSM
ncbi:MAG: hypothetical protein AAFN11_20785 [Chloroflexota bacterium]